MEDLDSEQLAAAAAVHGPVVIIAGAGTGKTRTVTHRLAHAVRSGAVDPGRALAITHSRKAAAELKERLGQLHVASVDARTFHAAGLRVAAQFWDRTGRSESGPSVLNEGEAWRIWRDAMRAKEGHDPDNSALRDLAEEVSWARSRLVSLDSYQGAATLAGRQPGVDADTVTACWEYFDRAKLRAGKVDFADLLDIAGQVISEHSDVAEAVRSCWGYITVDEYQDTDPAQQRLLDAILGDGEEICVVGDPRQAIYSWKGADPGYLTGFTKRYPAAKSFDLTKNYRSTIQILRWANSLASKRSIPPLVATKAPGPAPKITRLDDEAGEAAWVVGATRRAVAAGTPLSEIAVLYRYNATQARFEAAFAKADLATVIAEDVTFFDRQEVRSVLVPFGRSARSDPDGPGLEILQSQLKRAGFDADTPPPGLGAARARWESQSALLDLMSTLPGAETATASALLAQLNQMATSSHGPPGHGVTLATLHRAKGLEWDVVFIVGVTDGAIPSSYADTAAQYAEEERLLHVGVTRARRELHLTWPAANGRGWTNRPSPFFDQLPGAGWANSAGPGGLKAGPTGSARTGRTGRTGRTESRAAGGGSAPGNRRGDGKRARGVSGSITAGASQASSASCPHCGDLLRGASSRRIGVCAGCVTSAPGQTGRRARAVADVVAAAAEVSGIAAEKLVSPAGLMRLLDRRPATGEAVRAMIGVELDEQWAAQVATVLEG